MIRCARSRLALTLDETLAMAGGSLGHSAMELESDQEIPCSGT